MIFGTCLGKRIHACSPLCSPGSGSWEVPQTLRPLTYHSTKMLVSLPTPGPAPDSEKGKRGGSRASNNISTRELNLEVKNKRKDNRAQRTLNLRTRVLRLKDPRRITSSIIIPPASDVQWGTASKVVTPAWHSQAFIWRMSLEREFCGQSLFLFWDSSSL